MGDLNPSDRTTRYLYGRSQFTAGRVKYDAFRPPRDTDEVSVFITTGFNEAKIWGISDSARTDKTPKARADLPVGVIESLKGLKVFKDDKPEHHANIRGFPTDNAMQKLVAKDLANKATLVINK